MPADPLPVTRERIEAALDKIAAYVANGILTAEGIGPIWDRLERELANEPLHDRIMARAGRACTEEHPIMPLPDESPAVSTL